MVVLTLAAVDLHCRLGPLLCILYRDEHDTIEIAHVTHLSCPSHLVVLLLDGSGHARALPLEPHQHLWLAPEKTILGAQLLCFISSTVSSQATTRRASC